jgi:hypothetical protein
MREYEYINENAPQLCAPALLVAAGLQVMPARSCRLASIARLAKSGA